MEPSSSPSPKTSSPLWGKLREWLEVIVIALVISLPIRIFIAEPFIVNGASMDPTFSSGQFLIVDRLSYRFDSPRRDDVIVFEYPNNPRTYYIKRIIGLPNETVSIKNGRITITGKESPKGIELKENFIDPSHASYDTFSVSLGPTEYFVMGDNRAQSSDSRSWGPLKEDFIVGKPILRLLPINTVSIWPGKQDAEN